MDGPYQFTEYIAVYYNLVNISFAGEKWKLSLCLFLQAFMQFYELLEPEKEEAMQYKVKVKLSPGKYYSAVNSYSSFFSATLFSDLYLPAFFALVVVERLCQVFGLEMRFLLRKRLWHARTKTQVYTQTTTSLWQLQYYTFFQIASPALLKKNKEKLWRKSTKQALAQRPHKSSSSPNTTILGSDQNPNASYFAHQPPPPPHHHHQ